MKRTLLTIACVSMIAGCAVSKDGIGFAQRPPDPNKVAAVRDQLQQNADVSSSSGLEEATAAKKHPGILIIGTTGPLRPIEDKSRGGFYAAYLKAAEQ